MSDSRSTPIQICSEWNPNSLMNGSMEGPDDQPNRFALVILNTPINPNSFEAVIDRAYQVICADGGANSLYDYYSTKAKDADVASLQLDNPSVRFPDAIVGDLDSLRPEVESFFHERNVRICKESEQNSTDFAKCLHWLRQDLGSQAGTGNHSQPESVLDVVVLGGISGRLDQGLSLLHYMYLAHSDPTLLQGKMYLLSSQSLSFILAPGLNIIKFTQSDTKTISREDYRPSVLDCFSENVGIIPLSGPTTITTRGLEWDVTDWPTRLGEGLMSTSNHIRHEQIEIEVIGQHGAAPNQPLFTVELAQRLSTSREAKRNK